jgi:hypothetical protein
MKTYTAPDGTVWGVAIQLPGSSNSMILFRHPDGRSSRRDRYNWVLNRSPGALRVTSRLVPDEVLKQLDDHEIARLFSRSMPVSRRDPIEGTPEPVRG